MSKSSIFILCISILVKSAFINDVIQAQNLKLRYGLSGDANGSTTVLDESGNGNNGTLLNGAIVSNYNGVPVIDLGTTNGYADMGTAIGNIIASLTNFTIMAKVFIPSASNITGNGNFVWTFANSNNIGSDANGYMFFSAKNSRYAITPTYYTSESGIQSGSALAKGAWKTVIYVQKDGLGRLFIDGDLKVYGDITMNPSALGATHYNYLGRSCYSGDTYLNNAKLADFRIYDGAISVEQICTLSGIKAPNNDAILLVQFDFDKASDTSNTYTGSFNNGAKSVSCSGLPVLDLGADNGYFDFGSNLGTVIAALDSFSISTNIYIPNATSLTGNGNFVWTFANSANMASAANGNMFFSAIKSRYAITRTDYNAETSVNVNKELTKGKWINITYTQAYNVGRVFINGVMMADNTVTIIPSELGPTSYNYLGRSCYAGDVYIKNAQYNKFQLYKGVLTESKILTLCSGLQKLNDYLDSVKLVDAMTRVTIAGGDSAYSNLVLVKSAGDGVSVTWSSSNTSIITGDGVVTRPAHGASPVKVTLTAHLTCNNVSNSKSFELTVMPEYDDQTSVDLDMANLKITGNINNLRSAVGLPFITTEGSKVVWTSNSPDYINSVGKVLKLSPKGSGKKTVILTAGVSKGNVTATRNFEVKVAEDEGTSAYLFVYFTQTDEQIHFALSNDGYNYSPLKNGNPVIGSDTIAIKKAVRDPHILRANDGKTFYMVATDMKASEGWDSNRGVVMLKSTDLVNWTHATVNFPTKWPSTWANVTRVWAPETIYDPQTGKYIVYFSLLTNDGSVTYDKVYYCYANASFTDLEGEPVFLFDRGSATIDGDIVYNDADSLYHLFFKNEGSGGICKVMSKTITAPAGQTSGSQWSASSGTLQQTTQAVEGVGMFKLINSDNWVMMYDCYTSYHYQYCVSPDLSSFTYVQDNYNLSARHGTVMAITAEEAQRLAAKFPSSSLSNTPLGARNSNIRQDAIKIDNTNKIIKLPVYYGASLTTFDPLLYASPGTVITPTGAQDFSQGPVTYNFTVNGSKVSYQVFASIEVNPVIPSFHADPEILYSEKTGRFYIYPTTDGYANWGGYSFNVFSSPDLVNWTDEGTIIDFSTQQVSWATGNAWAPAIEEKKLGNNIYRYYFYFSGESGGKKIGVAVANDPTGPFVDSGQPLISDLPSGVSGGQQIDVDVFTDPVSGKGYIYWGNGYMAVAELNDDMISVKAGTIKVITPTGGTLSTYAYREGSYVFYRNGIYYFLWSVDDTGSSNYHVAYGTSSSPTGPITVAAQPIVIIQDATNEIYGTGHNSILKIPGKDEWYIVYHRINRDYLSNGPGIHREVCIDRLAFNADGTIKQTTPTRRGINPVVSSTIYSNYHPIVKETSNWSVLSGGIGLQALVGSIQTKHYKVSGDTTIVSVNYKKILLSTDSLNQNWTMIGFLREDTALRTVWMRDLKNNEGLIYDFDLYVGKDVTLYNPVSSGSYTTYQVTKVDSIFLQTEYRKAFTLSKNSRKMRWIEGVGSELGLIESNLYGLIGGFRELLCFSDEKIAYNNPKFQTCHKSNMTPYITNDKMDTAIINQAFSCQITTTPVFNYDSVSFYLSGTQLPNGLELNKTTGLISGIPTETGTFHLIVCVKNNGYVTDYFETDLIVNNGTAINTMNRNKMVEIYPNPTHGLLTINCVLNHSAYFLTITDLKGKQILSGVLDKEHNQINITDLADGVYVISIYDKNSGKKVLTDRLVKKE